MEFKRQWVTVMLGIPGSGKTHFAERLAAETGAELIDGDAICGELFTAGIYKTETERRRFSDEYDRRYSRALEEGRSVIRGNQHNSLKRRDELNRRLGEVGVAFFITHMKTPIDVANSRAARREINRYYPPTIRKGFEKIRDNAHQILRTFDPPAEHELYVEIDGTADFGNQLKIFAGFCETNNLTL
ncbi:ATP-binding protein [Candidatus Saccharibacteria bacterium]|nr:ATP-binding protein [Candidatus Saccharibacteria bacterium]